jgi:hypothetical protein
LGLSRPFDQFGTAYLRLGKELKEGFVITVEEVEATMAVTM